jgi:hypothetical protein
VANTKDGRVCASVKLSSRFAGEWWLDIRRMDILMPIMQARMDLAKQHKCDAIEPDNMIIYDVADTSRNQDLHNFSCLSSLPDHKRG